MRVLIESTSTSGIARSQQKNDDRSLFDMVSAPGSFCLLIIKRLGPIGYLQYGITMCTSRMVPSVVAEQNYCLVQIIIMSTNRVSGQGLITL